MNSLIVFKDEFVDDGLVEIRAERAEYVQRAHDLKLGLEVRAAVFYGKRGRALVKALRPNKVTLEISVEQDPLPLNPVHLIVAVPRPQTVKKIVQLAATMGLERVHLIRTEKVVKSYLTSQALEAEQIEYNIVKGLEQSGGSLPPLVALHKRFKPFVEDALAGLLEEQEHVPLKLIAHTDCGEEGLARISLGSMDQPVYLAVGPESGWNEFEVEQFISRGFIPVGLGERTLRVETAVAVLLGQVALRRAQA